MKKLSSSCEQNIVSNILLIYVNHPLLYNQKSPSNYLWRKIAFRYKADFKTNSEEIEFIQQIEVTQMKCECLRGIDVKEFIRKLFYMRTRHEIVFGRDWFWLFLIKYKDLIGKVKRISVDDRVSLFWNQLTNKSKQF